MKNSTVIDFDISDSFVVDNDVLKPSKKKVSEENIKAPKRKEKEVEVVLEIYKI